MTDLLRRQLGRLRDEAYALPLRVLCWMLTPARHAPRKFQARVTALEGGHVRVVIDHPERPDGSVTMWHIEGRPLDAIFVVVKVIEGR